MTKPPTHDRQDGPADVFAGLEREARIDRVAPMADAAAERPLTDAERADALQVAETFLRSPGITASGLAKMLGTSARTLRKVLAGGYGGDTDGILRRVRPAVNEHFRSLDAPGRGGLVRTATARRIFTALRFVSARRKMGIIYGPSGIGKSFTLQALLATDFPTGVYLEVHDTCKTPKTLYAALARALKIRGIPVSVSRATLCAALVEKLRDSGRLIVIDEADGLDLSAFNSLRQLHDQAGVPIILAGRPNLAKRIEATRRRDEIGASVAGRLVIQVKLDEPTVTSGGDGGQWICSPGELAVMLKKYRVVFEPEAIRWLCSLAHLTAVRGAIEEGGLRLALNVAELAATAAGDRAVTVTLCRAALQLLRGSEGAAELSDEMRRTVRREVPAVAAG